MVPADHSKAAFLRKTELLLESITYRAVGKCINITGFVLRIRNLWDLKPEENRKIVLTCEVVVENMKEDVSLRRNQSENVKIFPFASLKWFQTGICTFYMF